MQFQEKLNKINELQEKKKQIEKELEALLTNNSGCSGTGELDGSVPSVGWYGRQFMVGDCYPGGAGGNGRTRSAVIT